MLIDALAEGGHSPSTILNKPRVSVITKGDKDSDFSCLKNRLLQIETIKIFFVALWLLTVSAGGYGYNLYQQLQAENQTGAQSLAAVQAANADLTKQITSLKDQAFSLQFQLDAEKKVLAALRLAASVTPTSEPPSSDPIKKHTTPATIPSTITTLEGKTYTGCALSHVWPDGISFTHSTGVAKVLFFRS